MEIWKDIEGYEGLYQVSKSGNVKSVKRKILLKQAINRRGYPVVTLSKSGSCKLKTIHRLVAKAFIPNPRNKSDVNHMDGIKINNNLSNLEWLTRSENIKHAYATGLSVASSANKYGNFQGEFHHRCKLQEDDVRFIRENIKKNGGTMTYTGLAKQFGISVGTIGAIVSQKTWRHIL